MPPSPKCSASADKTEGPVDDADGALSYGMLLLAGISILA